MATAFLAKSSAKSESIQDKQKCPADIFRRTLPRLTTPLGQEPNFTAVTDLFFGGGLITKPVLDGIKTQHNQTGRQRGSAVAHALLDEIEVSDDPVQCLLKICDVLENEKIEDSQLWKHGDSMRRQLQANTDLIVRSHLHGRQPLSIITPAYLEDEYMNMNSKFGTLLLHVVNEALENKSLEDIIDHVLIFHSGMLEEVTSVKNKRKLIALLRKYCFLSSFSMLKSLVDTLELENAKTELEKFTKDRDEFYEKVLAEEFAQRVIEDHKKMGKQQEITFTVSWNIPDTTLAEFQHFLTNAFHHRKIFISLRAVHHSLLTFVCTIPDWFVEELAAVVKDRRISLELYGMVQVSINKTVIYEASGKIPTYWYSGNKYWRIQTPLNWKDPPIMPPLTEKKGMRILVIGRKGAGKSTLIDKLVGRKVRSPVKLPVERIVCSGPTGVQMEIYSTRGFGDFEQIMLQSMGSEMKDADLVLICHQLYGIIDVTVDMVLEESLKFCGDVLKHGMFVLTKGEEYKIEYRDHEQQSKEGLRAKMEAQQAKVERELQRGLQHHGKKLRKPIDTLPKYSCIVSSTDVSLPTTDNWLDDLWTVSEACCHPQAKQFVHNIKTHVLPLPPLLPPHQRTSTPLFPPSASRAIAGAAIGTPLGIVRRIFNAVVGVVLRGVEFGTAVIAGVVARVVGVLAIARGVARGIVLGVARGDVAGNIARNIVRRDDSGIAARDLEYLRGVARGDGSGIRGQALPPYYRHDVSTSDEIAEWRGEDSIQLEEIIGRQLHEYGENIDLHLRSVHAERENISDFTTDV